MADRSRHQDKRGQRSISAAARREIRDYVYWRDGGRCRTCDRPVPKEGTPLGHILPARDNGPYRHWNLRLSCRSCEHDLQRAAECPALMLLMRRFPFIRPFRPRTCPRQAAAGDGRLHA